MIDTNEIRESIPNRVIQDYEIVALCDEIDRLRGEQKTPQCQGKTVRVKVAVAVSSNGEWTAAGWHDGARDVVVETAMDAAFFPANVYWLTATLPVPAEVEVVAKVEGE